MIYKKCIIHTCYVLLTIFVALVCFNLGHEKGYVEGFRKHHSNIYVKDTFLQQHISLFTTLEKSGVSLTESQKQKIAEQFRISKENG